jgi:hypothetical protein
VDAARRQAVRDRAVVTPSLFVWRHPPARESLGRSGERTQAPVATAVQEGTVATAEIQLLRAACFNGLFWLLLVKYPICYRLLAPVPAVEAAVPVVRALAACPLVCALTPRLESTHRR